VIGVGRLAGAVLWLGLAGAWLPARSHDLITAEAAQRYLAQADAYLTALKPRQPALRRAEASYEMGRMLDEIRDLLNRDLAEHGRLQGLPTEYLVKSLQSRGVALQVDAQLGRFPANLRWYQDALAAVPDGAQSADAMFRLLQGWFYDSFTDDPLQPRGQPWTKLQEQMQLGERLLQRHPAHAEREEAQFIVFVHYVQAARGAPDAANRSAYAARARQAAADFRAVSRQPAGGCGRRAARERAGEAAVRTASPDVPSPASSAGARA
jgi:hypothetical protein